MSDLCPQTTQSLGLVYGSPADDASMSHRHGFEETLKCCRYRLASIAVDVETDLLARRSRRVVDKLRRRQRLWLRRYRSSAGAFSLSVRPHGPEPQQAHDTAQR